MRTAEVKHARRFCARSPGAQGWRRAKFIAARFKASMAARKNSAHRQLSHGDRIRFANETGPKHRIPFSLGTDSCFHGIMCFKKRWIDALQFKPLKRPSSNDCDFPERDGVLCTRIVHRKTDGNLGRARRLSIGPLMGFPARRAARTRAPYEAAGLGD